MLLKTYEKEIHKATFFKTMLAGVFFIFYSSNYHDRISLQKALKTKSILMIYLVFGDLDLIFKLIIVL